MTPFRIAFDLDGVLADFEASYRRVEREIFGSVESDAPSPRPEAQAAAEEDGAGGDTPSHESGLSSAGVAVRRDRVWRSIEAVTDFWATLEPINPEALPRLERLAAANHWEVFFITQRPSTAGETVQRQSQRWLERHGFELPSVIVLKGSRGRAAAALHLHYLVDDTIQNCVDVVSESDAQVVLVLPGDPESPRARNARRLGIRVVSSASQALDVLEGAYSRRANPSLLTRMARAVGWKGEG